MKVLVIIGALLASAVCIGIGESATHLAGDHHVTTMRRSV